MAFRTRRQARYGFLRQHGFLRFEAQTLSKISLRVPYFDLLIKERAQLFAEAISKKQSPAKYEKQIKDLYRERRWYKLSRTGKKIVADPWAMYREKEDIHKSKYPQYTSPWEKRQKDFRDFVGKTEKKVKSMYLDWISQLRESIKKAPTPEKKAQFEQRIKNLEEWAR
jgi:hypothetical protein